MTVPVNSLTPSQPPCIETSTRLELRLVSHTSELAKARKGIEQFAAKLGFDEVAQAQMGLCVNEAMANVIRHAYGGVAGKPIFLTAEYTPGTDAVNVHNRPAIRIDLRDWGNGQNPAELPQKPYNALEPGGVGLICLRGMMDELTYTPQPDGMLLTLVKRK